MLSVWCVVWVSEGTTGGMMCIGLASWPGRWLLPRMSPHPYLRILPNGSDSIACCKHLNSELGAQTALHLSVSKGVIQRKRESQSSATSSSNDNCRPGPMAQVVHTGMKYVLFT